MPSIEYGKKEFQQFMEKKYDTIRSKQKKIYRIPVVHVEYEFAVFNPGHNAI